ncbi:MAG: YggT family protein [Bacillota bacterium]
MTVLSNIIHVAFRVLDWLIIARVIMTWIKHDPHHPVIRFVYEITEPVLAPLRRLMPKGSMIDFSPILAFLVLQLVERLVLQFLGTL